MRDENDGIAALVLGKMHPEDGGGPPEGEEDYDPEDALVDTAEEILDCLQIYPSNPGESDTFVQRRSKEASKRAAAQSLSEALREFFEICESIPHDEGEEEEGPPEGEEGPPRRDGVLERALSRTAEKYSSGGTLRGSAERSPGDDYTDSKYTGGR